MGMYFCLGTSTPVAAPLFFFCFLCIFFFGFNRGSNFVVVDEDDDDEDNDDDGATKAALVVVVVFERRQRHRHRHRHGRKVELVVFEDSERGPTLTLVRIFQLDNKIIFCIVIATPPK